MPQSGETASVLGLDGPLASTGFSVLRRRGFGRRQLLLHRIVESSRCLILVIDLSADPCIDYVSPAIEMLMGYLNGFKLVNDRFGHETGDTLLRLMKVRSILRTPVSIRCGR